MGDTTIEWTEKTWNPVRGCTRVSEGCRNCYAERVAVRFSGAGQPYEGLVKISQGHPQWTGHVQFVEEHLEDPLRWNKPRRIFVNSMSDLFHEGVSDTQIDRIFAVMGGAYWHTFQVLTKRPERMQRYFTGRDSHLAMTRQFVNFAKYDKPVGTWPLPNVWMGVSCENQATADERISLLLQTPAAVRWVSAEPLLGSINLERIVLKPADYPERGQPPVAMQALSGWHGGTDRPEKTRINWIVAGGESGPGARPMHPDWARSIRDQCQAAGVPFFFKQWGEWHTAAIRMSEGTPVFRQFRTFEQWVNHAQTWINGGICLDSTGKELKIGADFMRARDEGKFPVTVMHKVGKKAAGRLLDGREWNEYPG